MNPFRAKTFSKGRMRIMVSEGIMKKLFLSLLVLLATIPLYAGNVVTMFKTAAPPAGPTQVGYDDFAGDLTKWTQFVGTWTATSGQLQSASTGFIIIGYDDADCSTANGYAKLSLVDFRNETSIYFRAGGDPVRYYYIKFSAVGTEWFDSDDDSIETSATTWANTDVAGITWTGTGDNTVIRIWKNPTGNTPDSATSWGSDTTPDISFTANPGANAVDSGGGTGISATVDSGTLILDNYYFGDL